MDVKAKLAMAKLAAKMMLPDKLKADLRGKLIPLYTPAGEFTGEFHFDLWISGETSKDLFQVFPAGMDI